MTPEALAPYFDEIERDHPDIVVQEFVARHFFAYAPSPELIPD